MSIAVIQIATLNPLLRDSYDLDLDTRLAEETTVLVESYTVSPSTCTAKHTLTWHAAT